MRFTFAVTGSRGDVQPAVALAAELIARGHQVSVAAPPNLVDFASGAGIPADSYGESTRELLDSDVVRSGLRSRNPRTRLRAISAVSVHGGRTMQRRLLDLADGSDAIIATSAGQERAHNVASVLGIPHVPLHYCPMRRNPSVSLLAHLGVTAPGPVNDLSWRLAERALWLGTRSAENTLRAELGLPRLSTTYSELIAATGVPEIQAYDPALFPGLAAHWGSRRPLVGFFDLGDAQRAGVGDAGLDDDLRSWLDAGDPPVYLGFGSMLPPDPHALATAVRTAAARLGLRFLVGAGWSGFLAGGTDTEPTEPSETTGGPGESGDTIRVVGHVDHATILPRCRAAVHHGGAGSVAAGLRAGLPTVVTWLGADQPIWGQVLRNARVGASLPMARATGDSLVAALESVLTPDTARRARELRDRLTPAATAVRTAADVVERVVG